MFKPIKIILADLSHTHTVSDSELTVPLNIGYVKAYALENLKVAADIDLFKHPQRFLDRLKVEQPDVVGFSNYTWNLNLNFHLGKAVRKILPDALIVGGGPNLDNDVNWRRSFLKKNDYLDFLIVGGGEEPFTELVDWWIEASDDRRNLPSNLVWLYDDEVKSSGERQLEKQIKNIPSPYLAGYLDEFLDAGMVPLIESNRGCPFKCSFCAWGAASRDLLRRLDFDTILAELDYVANRSNARNWVLCDANFGILERDIEIAQRIRNLRDSIGYPVNVQTFVAKNVTDRNLKIGAILNDMTLATMSFQSFDPEVLINIERDNISLDTYREYKNLFTEVGQRTYSELIIPLPGETRDSHISALKHLIDSDVHELNVHNLRMLAGTKINSQQTRDHYSFKTRYRLIHGDAGIYKFPDGSQNKIFEYEESLRCTATMSESDIFYFRILQFFVEFAWNMDVYGPLLKIAHKFGIQPINILMDITSFDPNSDLAKLLPPAELLLVEQFMNLFNEMSEKEWFDSEEEIEAYFSEPQNFQKLIDLEFDKLNILCSVIILREYKDAFDIFIKTVIAKYAKIPPAILDYISNFTFKRFPGLDQNVMELEVPLPVNLNEINANEVEHFEASTEIMPLRMYECSKRREVRMALERAESHTLSKIINTQRLYLRHLKLTLDSAGSFQLPFLYCSD